MRPLTSAELLSVWEQSVNQSLIQKSLALLRQASSGLDSEDVSSLPIGERDFRLLKLRSWMFGSVFRNMADCPKCSERVEWETQLDELQLSAGKNEECPKQFDLELNEYKISFRLPDSNDILRAIDKNRDDPDPNFVLSSCILKATFKGRKINTDKLPEKIVNELSRKIEEFDPAADIQMSLSCPNCQHSWLVNFDILSYFWAEIDSWSRRMFQDIYTLARAFGWSENDILTMNPYRRNIYVEMLRA